MMELAYFSPLPPAHSGIADYSKELLPYLSKYAQISLFTDEPEDIEPSLREQFPTYHIGSYPPRRWHYDVALYQMGNSAYHETMYRIFLRYPGIVVLHDYGLHQFIAYRTLGQAHPVAYQREMGYALGVEGIRQAREAIAGHCTHPWFSVPLNDRLLDLSLGLIVHSQYVQTRVRKHSPDLPVAVIPAPIGLSYTPRPRSMEGWPADAVVIASLGLITAAKQLDQALRAFKRLRKVVPEARYLIIGSWLEAEVAPDLIQQLGLENEVRYIGHVDSLQMFVDWLGTADIVVNLRNPTAGETSATALRALAAGRAIIVSDHGWYAELPDEVCVKVAPGSEEDLYAAMLRLATDREFRAAMGARAASFVATTHSPAMAAERYHHIIQQILAGQQTA